MRAKTNRVPDTIDPRPLLRSRVVTGLASLFAVVTHYAEAD